MQSMFLRPRRATLAATLAAATLAAIAGAQTTERVNLTSTGAGAQGGSSPWCSVSLDGSRIAFSSSATNLVPGDVNGSTSDVFVRDRATAATILISESATTPGNSANGPSVRPRISANGTWVAFESDATNLVNPSTASASAIWMRSLQTLQMILVSRHMNGSPANTLQESSISGNGRYVAYASFTNDIVPSDTNGQTDIFVFDRTTLTTIRASLDSGGMQANGNCYRPGLSQTGRYLVFESPAANFGASGSVWQISSRISRRAP
jgi:Tol biopolymer transport system component